MADCIACGVRQRVDEIAETSQDDAIDLVLEKCTGCSDHPNASTFKLIGDLIGMEFVSKWEPRS